MMGLSAIPAPRNKTGRPDGTVAVPPVLQVNELKTHFVVDDALVRAVDGVSLSIRRGETVAVVGESGSGKTVTGLSIMRLLMRTPARIVGGTIEFHGKDGTLRDLVHLPESAMTAIRGSEISMIFQDPMSSLNPLFTIGDQLCETIRYHRGGTRAAATAIAVDTLEHVGFAHAATRLGDYPHQLSGGMRQRVMIAIALSCNPRLLIADEPTTALDVTIQAQIVELLKELQRERDMAMLFITHDLALIGEVAHRVAVMYAGQVVEDGPTEEVLQSPHHPYTRALLDCIPHRRYGDGGNTLKPIPGAVPNLSEPVRGCRFAPRCTFAETRCHEGETALRDVSERRRTRCLRWEELAGAL
jgi:oligopeptide/dipeptide ABC transporter ATP-binding protein